MAVLRPTKRKGLGDERNCTLFNCLPDNLSPCFWILH
jgi:hypothetical protein